MSEVNSNTQFQEIGAVQEPVIKKKKSLIKRFAKGVKKRVGLLNHGRQNSGSNLSVEDSAHSTEGESLSVTGYPSYVSLQVTQEESTEDMPMQPQMSGIHSPPIISQSVEEEEEVDLEEEVVVSNQPEEHSEKEDDHTTHHPDHSHHALAQLGAIVTIQRHFKRYLKAKRTSSAMEEMLRKAVQEMEAESPGRKKDRVAARFEERRSFGEQITSKRENFFMLKMGVATLIIAVVLRYAVLPLLDI